MDYSLVVGIDSQKQELVVGIVGRFFFFLPFSFFLFNSVIQPASTDAKLIVYSKYCRLYTDIHMGEEARKSSER